MAKLLATMLTQFRGGWTPTKVDWRQKHGSQMDRRHVVRTGDVLLFSGNSPTSFLLRTFVSSEWNHSGIAVRFVNVPDDTAANGYRKEISLTEEGELYILETNTGQRTDDIYGYPIVGAGFSRADWVCQKYNKIAVRYLHEVFRTPELARPTMQFHHDYRGNKFPSNSLPFLSVWLGIRLSEKDKVNTEMFCSELMAHYYIYAIGPQYERVTGIPFDGRLTTLFGTGAPRTEDMFTPGHYTHANTPNASIFKTKEDLIYVAHADLFYIILQPLLIILFIMLLLWMILPH